MSQAKIRVAIKNKNKSEEAFLYFQKVTTHLRKKCRASAYFVRKSLRKVKKFK